MVSATKTMPVPFVDLKAQYAEIASDIRAAIDGVMANTAFILGPAVTDFETAFAEYCHTAHCVGLNTGTSALHLALHGLGVGPGDEVITVSMSFIATVWPILYLGAKPVFVDIDPRRYTLDPKQLEKAITKRTKAILPVHLYGQCADMDPILEIANRHDIPVIEDACQAHGAEYKGRRAGSMGAIGCFSFYPGKNLGAYGEGGAIVTNNARLAERARMLRDHGQRERYVHETLGYNYRMDGFQGAVLGVKLRRLEKWTTARQAAAARYDQRLGKVRDIVAPATCPDGRHAYHLYVVRSSRRDALRDRLQQAGVGTGFHYPIPIHLQKPLSQFGYSSGMLPVTEDLARTCLSLPMHAHLSDDQITHVTSTIAEGA